MKGGAKKSNEATWYEISQISRIELGKINTSVSLIDTQITIKILR